MLNTLKQAKDQFKLTGEIDKFIEAERCLDMKDVLMQR